MKRIICTLLIAILIISSVIPLYADSGAITVKLNNMTLLFDVPPTNIEGRALVPLRRIFEELGFEVTWDGANKTAVGKKAKLEVRLQQDSSKAFVNGNEIMLDVPPTAVKGRVLVPVRFIAESTGAKVFWDEGTRTVYISTSDDSTLTLEKIKASAALSDSGRISDKMGKSEDALIYFNKAIAIDPYNCYAYYYKGQIYEKQKNRIEALKNYHDALLINRNSPDLHRLVGNILLELEKYDEAANEYEEFAKYQNDKYAGSMLVGLGADLAKKNKYEEAIAFYDIAIRYCTDKSYVELAYYHKANALYYLHRYEGSLLNFDKAIEISPSNSYAYNNKGVVYMTMGNYAESLKCYDKAIELNPKEADFYVNKGHTLFIMQKYDEALAPLLKGMQIDATKAHPYGLKVQELVKQKKYEEAYKYCDKAIEVLPNSAYLYVLKGSIYFEEKKYAESIEMYNKAAELDNKYLAPYLNNAINYAILNNQEKALENLRRAIELDSTVKLVVPKLSYFDNMKNNEEFIRLINE